MVVPGGLLGCTYSKFVPYGVQRRTPPGVSTPTVPQSGGLKPSNDMVQTCSSGYVTFDVKWQEAGNGKLTFGVSMDTHSVELDGYDLGKSSILQDDQGNEYRPQAWDSAPGGHHRSGSLVFPLPDSVAQGAAKYLQLEVKETDGGDRVFRWDLQ